MTDEIESIIARGSLDDIYREAKSIQAHCEDFKVTGANSSNVRLTETGGILYVTDDADLRNSPISRFALSQLCTKIGVPSQYLDKCISTGRISLAQDNVSSWLTDYNGNLFIREYRHNIRGVLSQKFSICDTPEILEVLKDTIPDDFEVRGYYLSPERFHLRVTEKNKLPIPNEDLFGGFTINSSDVGRSQLTATYLMYKQVCSNGLCLVKGSGRLFQQKHIGITAEAFRKGLRENIELIPKISAELMKNVETVRNSGKIIRDFADDSEIERVVDLLRNQFKLSESQAGTVINIFEHRLSAKDDFNYENNLWGLINSVTEMSRSLTLDRRNEIEGLAGNFLVA